MEAAADKICMINAVSSNACVPPTQNQSPAAHSAGNAASPAEDTVHLSSAAKAALGDAAQGDPDHDGH